MGQQRLGRRRWSSLSFAAPVLLSAALVLPTSCQSNGAPRPETEVVYRGEMRTLVQEIAAYAKAGAPGFVVIPQNGQELLTTDGDPEGPLATEYLRAIDGQGREDLFYGYDRDNVATPEEETDWMAGFLDRAVGAGVTVLVTDYCSSPSLMDDSYQRNDARGYVGFAAPSRELDTVPSYPANPVGANARDITSLGEAENFLYLLNPDRFASREEYLSALDDTDYDALIIDAFHEESMLSPGEVERLQSKPGDGRRLVVSYLSIGEAEEYRYYWRESWYESPPPFLEEENRDWPGNYLVRYWEPEWKAILFGSSSAYLDRILSAGFDGVYLDIIDAFERWEEWGVATRLSGSGS